MAKIFKVQDIEYGMFLKKGAENSPIINKNNLSKDGGRIFSRKGDFMNHINQNIKFYSENINRLRLVECDFVIIQKHEMADVLQNKIFKLLKD